MRKKAVPITKWCVQRSTLGNEFALAGNSSRGDTNPGGARSDKTQPRCCSTGHVYNPSSCPWSPVIDTHPDCFAISEILDLHDGSKRKVLCAAVSFFGSAISPLAVLDRNSYQDAFPHWLSATASELDRIVPTVIANAPAALMIGYFTVSSSRVNHST